MLMKLLKQHRPSPVRQSVRPASYLVAVHSRHHPAAVWSRRHRCLRYRATVCGWMLEVLILTPWCRPSSPVDPAPHMSLVVVALHFSSPVMNCRPRTSSWQRFLCLACLYGLYTWCFYCLNHSTLLALFSLLWLFCFCFLNFCFLARQCCVLCNFVLTADQPKMTSVFLSLCRPHLWSRNKINSVLATNYFISAPSIRTCRAEIK